MNQQRSSSPPAGGPGPAGALSDANLAAFEADVEAAMQTFQMPGAAIALVQDNHIVYARGFGVRDLQSNAPVSPHTRFRIASNTKSMTSLLAATFVDQGVLDWDAPVLSVWPEFLAPTPALTRSLRLRDLLGMGSGIAESPTIEFFMSAGAESALDQLRSIAYLPVIAPPDTEYYYNNTLTSAAGYLGPIAQGTPQSGWRTRTRHWWPSASSSRLAWPPPSPTIRVPSATTTRSAPLATCSGGCHRCRL